MSRAERGYTLVEVAVFLVVGGLLITVLVQLLPKFQHVLEGKAQQVGLEALNEAVIGFALVNSRLPCPDTDNDGDEDCGGGAVGTLPFTTIGVADHKRRTAGIDYRYGVYRNTHATPSLDSDLAVLINRFDPLLPPGQLPLNNLNGRDFCMALQTAARSAASTALVHVGTTPAHINTAFVIADSGALDADLNGNRFDGGNDTGPGFALPTMGQSSVYDDRVMAVGFNELSGRLRCAAEIAAVNAAARTAFSAYDMQRYATLQKNFRDFEVMVRTHNRDDADARLDYAIAVDFFAVGTGATSALIAAETAGGATGAVFAAGAAIAAAIGLTVKAQLKLDAANAALTVALTHQTNAINALAAATAYAAATLTAVQAADARDILQ